MMATSTSSFTRGRCRQLFVVACLAALCVIVSTADIDQEDLVFDDLTSDSFTNHQHWSRQSNRAISHPVDSPSVADDSSNQLEQSSGILSSIHSGFKRIKRGIFDFWDSAGTTESSVDASKTTRSDRNTRSTTSDTEEFKASKNDLTDDRNLRQLSDDEDIGGESGDASGGYIPLDPLVDNNRNLGSVAFYRITLSVIEPHRQEYEDGNSQLFKDFSKNFSTVVDHLFDDVPGTQKSQVIKVERLSDPFQLKVTLDIVSTDNHDSETIKRKLYEQIQRYNKIGNFTVSPQHFLFREASATPHSVDTCQPGQIQCSSVSGENCLPPDVRCNGIDDCLDGRDEEGCPLRTETTAIRESSPLPTLQVVNTTKHCRADDSVRCADGSVSICADEKCDGKPDCPDGDDELNCPNECAAGEFMCDITRCIPEHNVCDDVKQCVDGTDERECPMKPECPGEFLCDSNRCIPQDNVCNGVEECSDKSDESNCPSKSECPRDDFQCYDGTCIRNFEKCNQVNDCRSGEDELNCPCPPDHFQCTDGSCVLQTLYCNGAQDCLDNSDEEYCIKINKTTECTQDQFTCNDGSCILQNLRCNGAVDCPDQSDEVNCSRNQTGACSRNQWQCNDGMCLDASVRCNQRVDCPRDRSDEEDCPENGNHRQCTASEFRCRNGICIDLHRKCDDKTDCTDNSDEQSCPCTENDFKCGNGFCIPMDKRCDHINDCQDMSDEQFCQIVCQSNESKCRNGECIPTTKLCNHVRDCSDGSDEDNCAICRADQFRCQEGLCLTLNSVCNGHPECAGGEDERNCGNTHPVICRDTEFKCNDLTCIHLSKRCNGVPDCPDQSDEEAIICDLGLAPCPPSDFTCSDGSCISKDKQCNGRPDCPESSDEIGCSPDGNTNHTLHCMSGEFRCKDGKKCIRESYRCDKLNDCDDYSDEEDCDDSRFTCSPTDFTCTDGSCLPKYLECNGQWDCEDGSDERHCQRRTCSSSEITCGDGSCVSKNLECNGHNDCPDGNDERNCQLLCDEGRCVPLTRKCDGYPDCYDNTDERNCSCRSDQFQCRDGRCIFAQQRCDRRPDCRDRSDEENCPVECSSLEFRCHSGECIPNHQHCDRQYHCPDGSDEADCSHYLENPTTTQPTPHNRVRCDYNQFACHSGDQCVPSYAHCDQNRDCNDASDEYNCANTPDLLLLKTYPTDQIIKESREVVFQCRDEGPLRANVRWVRDKGEPLPPGSRDLRGRLEMPNIKLEHAGKYTCEAIGYPESTPGSRVSVELVVEPFVQPTIRPPKACEYNEATCSNGDCIAKSLVCDGHYDCIDGSDELRCNRHGCEPNQFRCDNMRCVQKTWRCDSDDDCGDGSDERNCGTSPPGSQCRYDEYMCARGTQCIPKAFHCDMEVDCIDRSDELGCSKVTIQTPPPPMVVLEPGDLFTITCTAVGVPAPEVIWRLNWGHIPEKCNSSSVNGFGTLICPNIQESDQGAYSCEAMNSRGSVFAIPDTILVVKSTGGTPCPPGQFNEIASKPEDCIKCFCFGVTTQCKSADLFTYQLPPPLESYRIVNAYVSPSGSVEIRPEDSQYLPSLRTLGNGFQITTTNNELNSYNYNQPIYPYFALPENYYGNQLKSYGGYIKYTVKFEGSGAPLDIPDVILTGNDYTLIYKGYPLSEGNENNVAVQIFPQNWYKVTSNPRAGGDIPSVNREIEHATREDLMMALEKVDNILIRTQYVTNGLETTLTDIHMDSAGYRNTGQGKAAFVEECSCPPGYTGLSCEKCAAGYLHQESGPWLGHCYSGNVTCPRGTYGDPRRGIPCEPCPCPLTTPSNQFGRTCSLGQDGSVICDCPTGYQGRRCETCARGYTGNPLTPGDSCRRTVGICDPAGSISTEPDSFGRCICKTYATGSTCNQCKPNTFNLASTNDFGCVSCFCMGINTTCDSSNLYRTQISAAFTRSTQDFQLVLSNRLHQPFSDNIQVNPSSREIIYQGFLPEVYYWVVPSRFLYNKVTSYGGNLRYTLRYVPTPGGQSSRNNAPDVEIVSVNGVHLSYFHNEQLEPNRPVTVSVPLLEQYWQRSDGQRANREHLLMTLAELENIYIKATYTTNTQEAGLISVSLDIAEDRNTGQNRAVEVEQCACPAGYRGTSCEECEAGYTRVEEGLYLGICELCNCNGHSTQCDPELGVCMNCGDNTEGDQCDVCQPGFVGNPLNGGRCSPRDETCNCDTRGTVSPDCRTPCICKTNVEGSQCDRCREGTFDLSISHIEGCLECVCSGVSHTCQSSNLYREQIPMQIIDRNHTFKLTDISRQEIIQDGFLLNVAMNEIGFDFNNQRGQRLFWSLPAEFTGNKITSYGGNLTFTQHYTALPNVNPSYDTDVVIVGSGITLYWTSEDVLHPNQTRTTTIPLIERYWRRNEVQRTASRADMLNALSNIDAILIRASHSTHTILTYLSDVALDSTVTWRNGQSVATSVEVCRCPPGYKGTSCESCTAGYYKDYDRTCKRCPCNNNEEYCALGPNSQVVCYCKPTYAGPSCATIGGSEEPPYPTRQPSPPTISITLSEPTIRIVEAGSSVRYTCSGRSLVSRGPIRIAWSKEGGPLPDRAIDDSQGILIITNVRVSDSGTYICSASDGYSLVTERAQLTVGGGQSTPPRVTIEPPYLQVREGQPVEFRCTSSGVPTPNLEWERGGQDSRLNPQSSFSNGVFRIPYVSKRDEAHYRCIATNPSGSSDESVTLHVIESTPEPAPSPPEPTVALSVEPREYSGRPGDTVRLRCVSSSNRNVRFRWTRLQQQPLPASSQTSEGGELTIYNVTPNDSGIYLCIAISATTGVHESEVQARINIIGDSPRPVSIHIEPDKQTVSQGSIAELRCIPQSQGTIHWSKAGETDLPSNVQLNGPILRISNIRVEDRGVYICSVQGSEGSSRTSAIIDVERREPPSITLYPRETQTVIEGGSALFQCRLTGGIPPPSLRWSRPDNKPYPTRNIEELTGGVLRFNSVTKDEEGQYMCSAENPAGSRTVVATLEVQSYPVISIFPPSPVIVSPGQRVRLECRATGFPQPTVSWSRNQKGVAFYNLQEITAKTPQTAIYEITSVNQADDGSYTCTAQNAAGPVEERIQLVVNGDHVTSAPGRGDIPVESNPNPYGTSPTGIVVDEAFSAPFNGSVELRCATSGPINEEIFLKWVRSDGTPLPSRHILHDGTLHIDHLQYSDAGAYVCQAIGRDGSIYFHATTNLKVTVGLQIRLEPTRQVVKPGDNAEITCTATGETPIEITWMAVGRELPASVTIRGGHIRFQNIKESDAGRYMCRARDSTGQIAQSNSDVIVNEHNLVTAVDRHPRAYEGSSIRLRCDTDTNTQISWTRDGQPLPYNSIIQGSILRLDNIRLDDRGRYICHANTSSGTASDYIDLQVEHLESNLDLNIEPSKNIVNFGDSVDVRCFAKGAPNTRVYWSKLYSNLVYNERTNGDMLRIDNANAENSGTFRCTAQSQSGTVVEKDYVLNVEEKPTHDAAAVEVLSVDYGTTIPLECKTDLEPPVTYSWSKQGSVLPSHTTPTGALLNIPSVSYQDAGFYICTANNSNVRMDIPRLLIVKGAVPFFSQAPNSYLSLPTLPNAYLFFEIEISFKPQRPDGLILYNGQQGGIGDFISFGLRDGYPEFRFDMGSGPAVIKGTSPLSMDEWHTVKLSRSKKNGAMYVDGQGPFQGVGPKRHQGLDLNQPLFVGGVPDFVKIHKLNGFESGFVGCVSRLVIGKTEHDLMKDALVKNLVTSCETCAVNPCSNNGACQEAPTAQGFTCICPRGFSGDTCNKIGEPCYPGACGKGRCVNGEEGIECYCPLGKGGNRCSRDVSVTIPAFTSDGYLAYPTPKSHLKSRFTLKFKANDTSDGILMYCAENGDGQGDFVSLAIKNRRLEFRFETGSGVVELKNIRDIPTGQWLTVYAERSSREGKLAVSGELAVSTTLPGVSKGLDLRTPLYIGGFDKEHVQIARPVGVNRGFVGCISEVDVSGTSLTLSSVTDTANVGECLDSQGAIGDPCKYHPCLHNGVCYPSADGRNFDCVCQTGYSGTLCEVEQDMCAALNPCDNGGSCIGTSNSYKCNCPMGYSGATCQHKSELRTEASFQRDGYIELSSNYLPHVGASDEEQIIVEFSTNQPNGLIFWHGQTPDTDGKGQDYVSLAVVNGYLELSYELGSDPAVIQVTEQRVDDGKKHKATVKRQAKDGALELDNDIPTAFGASPGLLTQLNTKGNIYIGGLPNIDLMTGGRYSQAFSGCIHSLQIQQSGVINFAEKALSAINVLPCSSTNDEDYDDSTQGGRGEIVN